MVMFLDLRFLSCLFCVENLYSDENGVITKMVYEEGTGDACPTTHSRLITIPPDSGYRIKLEILQNSFNISDIKVNDNDIGNCKPSANGSENCTFYDCSNHLDWKYASSERGVLFFEWISTEYSQRCECDKETWECGVNLISGSQITNAARITLTPIGI